MIFFFCVIKILLVEWRFFSLVDMIFGMDGKDIGWR